jgi:hypothetical protein
MSWRSVSLTACSCALLAAGCGGGSSERLPVLTALRLERLAERHDCRGLSREAIAEVNRHEVPAGLQEPLLAETNRCRFPSAFRP